MRCSEIINILEELAPHRMACEWDNPGLLAGRKEKEVKKLLLCVDADDEAVALAVRQGADMIVSHHPLIFRSIKRVTDEDFIGRRLVEMIQLHLPALGQRTPILILPPAAWRTWRQNGSGSAAESRWKPWERRMGSFMGSERPAVLRHL